MKKQPAPEPEPAWATSTTIESHNDENDNRKFAEEYSKKKAGTILPAKSQAGGNRQKSVKQSKANQKAAPVQSSPDITAPSSAAGGDADDDQSAQNSPELSATSNDTPVTNDEVSDMLEAPAPGPKVLNITAPINPPQQKKAKAPAFEPVESKKARQNRKKAEEKKAAREEEEAERKKLA